MLKVQNIGCSVLLGSVSLNYKNNFLVEYGTAALTQVFLLSRDHVTDIFDKRASPTVRTADLAVFHQLSLNMAQVKGIIKCVFPYNVENCCVPITLLHLCFYS
jgi:hypothetical protein